MKTINYNITLLIILLIFASCKTEDSGSDAGTDAQDTVDVSGQEDIEEDISVTDDIINCIDNDGDQYGEGDDCLGTDCDDNDPDNWISCSACIDSDSDNYFANCDSYTTIQGPDCDDNVLECNSDCSDTNNNNHRDCDEECVDNDRDGYGEGTDCLGQDCNDSTGTCTTDCSDNDGDGIEDCNFCIEHPHEIFTEYESYSQYGFPFYFKDNYAYSLGRSEEENLVITILDISNPYSPERISGYDIGHPESNLAFGYDSSIYIQNNYIYIALHSDIEDKYGLLILDADDITEPYEIGYYQSNDILTDLYVDGTYCYLTIYDGNNEIYGMKIIDLLDPQNSEELGFFQTPTASLAVGARDNYAYLGDETTFYIIDVTDPLTPIEISSLTIGSRGGEEILINGNYAYINTGGSIVDISDAANPVRTNISLSTGLEWGSIMALYVSGKYAFVSEGGYTVDPMEMVKAFTIFDISNIESPEVIVDSLPGEDEWHRWAYSILYQNGYLNLQGGGVYSLLCEP